MIKSLHHTGISTSSLKRMLEFYCDVLGFELVMQMEWKARTELGDRCDRIVGLTGSAAQVAMVKKNGASIEFFEYSSPAPNSLPSTFRACDHGYTHICLEVEDIDAEYERLRNAGMTFHQAPARDPYHGMKAIYGKDPEGNLVELLEFVPAD
jgi:glyoxylase I family protein